MPTRLSLSGTPESDSASYAKTPFIGQNTKTRRYSFPYIVESMDNAKKRWNKTLAALDRVVSGIVVSTRTSPPASPSEGDAHRITATASGIWAGKEDQIAVYNEGNWFYIEPIEGLIIYDQGAILSPNLFYSGSEWRPDIIGITKTMDWGPKRIEAGIAGSSTLTENTLTNFSTFNWTFPTGVDTSVNKIFIPDVLYYEGTAGRQVNVQLFTTPQSTASGNVSWTVRMYSFADGDDLNGSADLTISGNVQTGSFTADQRELYQINDLQPNSNTDRLHVIEIERVGTAGADTYSGTIHLDGIKVEYREASTI